MPAIRSIAAPGLLAALLLAACGDADPDGTGDTPTTPAERSAPAPAVPAYDEIRNDVKASIDVSLVYQRWQLGENGSWADSPGTTGLLLRAYMESHRGYVEDDGPFIRNPLAYLASQADGTGMIGETHPVFETAAAAMPLATSGNPDYADEVERATAYLTTTLDADPPPGAHDLAFIADAFRAAGVTPDSAVWDRVVALAETAEVDGDPTTSAALRVYTLLGAGLGPDDARVQAAWNSFTAADPLDHLADDDRGLYHRHAAVAGALRRHGEEAYTDRSGRTRDWKAEVATSLMHRQQLDGYWEGADPFRGENDQFVASSLALFALETIYN